MIMYDLLFLGWVSYLFFIYVYMHSSPYLCVYGDDRITCYSGANDLTGEPGDA